MKRRNFTSVTKYSDQPASKKKEFHGITEPWQTVNHQMHSSKEFFLNALIYNIFGIIALGSKRSAPAFLKRVAVPDQ